MVVAARLHHESSAAPRACSLIVSAPMRDVTRAGPCFSLGSRDTLDGRTAPTLSGVGSMTAAWRPGVSGLARLSWHRTFTQDDQDRDVVTLGVARLWGE
jgi:hypothetical protein